VSRTKTEVAVAALGAVTFGALLASFMALRPVRDALVLEGNPDNIPWLFTGTFVVITLVTPVWGKLVASRPRHGVPIAFHVFAVLALVFFALIRAGVAPVHIGHAFYMWSAVYNIFVVSVFWSLLADLLGHAIAQNLYGPIAAGGTVGGVVGPLLTKTLLPHIGVAGVLVITAVLLETAAIGAVQLRRVAQALQHDAPSDAPLRESALEGLRRLGRDRFLLAIAGFVLCTTIAGTFVYLAQADIVKRSLPDKLARTDFYATLDLWINAGTLVIQLLLAAPLLRWLGPGVLLCVLPLAQGIGILSLVAAPTLATLVIVQIIGRVTTHGINRPARELLFTVVSRDDKYRAKNVIDTLVFRLGDTLSGWIHAGGLTLSLIAVPLTAVWLSLAAVLGAGFRRRTALRPKESS
jgi:AAA family ATP:ADP antiporter